jgi:hypothetical protein
MERALCVTSPFRATRISMRTFRQLSPAVRNERARTDLPSTNVFSASTRRPTARPSLDRPRSLNLSTFCTPNLTAVPRLSLSVFCPSVNWRLRVFVPWSFTLRSRFRLRLICLSFTFQVSPGSGVKILCAVQRRRFPVGTIRARPIGRSAGSNQVANGSRKVSNATQIRSICVKYPSERPSS